jgi:hypothetical protein
MFVQKENFNYFTGPVVSNPFEGVDPDTQIYIEQGRFVPNDPPGVYPVHNLAHYNGVLLSVHFVTEDSTRIDGSAVMVAPGIAVTAAHVIDPHISLIMASKRHVFCAGLTPSGPRYWHVRHFTKANGTDLVILSLDLASPVPHGCRLAQAMLTTRLPKIGELVMIAGFRASDENVTAEDGIYFPVKDGRLKYGIEVRIGVGEVSQHHLGGRGAMPPGPAIEVACSTPGGLSGGPVFDQAGMLVGILSTSFDVPDGRGPSQVSLLWPALVQTITPAFLPRLYPGPIKLLDLDPNLCGIDRRDAIHSMTDNENGLFAWEG